MGAEGYITFYSAQEMEDLGFTYADACSVAAFRTYEWTKVEFPFLKKRLWVVYDGTNRFGSKWDYDSDDDEETIERKKVTIKALKQCKLGTQEVWT